MRAQVDDFTAALRDSSWCLQLREGQGWVPGSQEAVPIFVSKVVAELAGDRQLACSLWLSSWPGQGICSYLPLCSAGVT